MRIVLSLYSDIPNNTTLLEIKYRLPNFYEALAKSLSQYNDVLLLVNNDLIKYQHTSNKALDPHVAEQYGKCIEAFNPELIIAVNNSFCSDFKYKFDCPYLILTVDSIKALVGYPNIECNENTYVLIPAEKMADEAMAIGFKPKKIIYSLFPTGVYAQNLPFIHDISFIGSVFTNGILEPIKKKIKKRNKEELDMVISSYENDRRTKFTDRVSNELLKDINNIKSTDGFVKQYFDQIDLFCLNDISQRFREDIISECAKFNLGLYGTKDWISQKEQIKNAYIKGFFYTTQHNQDIYNSSKLNFNICHKQAIGGFSWRITDVMASNGLLVSDSSIEKTWNNLYPSIKLPFYTNKNEIYGICKKYLKEENLRKDLVSQCQEKVDLNHRFENVFEIISDSMNIRLMNYNDETKTYSPQQIDNFDIIIKREYSFLASSMKKTLNAATYNFRLIIDTVAVRVPKFFKFLRSLKSLRSVVRKIESILTFKENLSFNSPLSFLHIYKTDKKTNKSFTTEKYLHRYVFKKNNGNKKQ